MFPMRREMGLSVSFPNETVFQSGYFDRVEYISGLADYCSPLEPFGKRNKVDIADISIV